MIFSADIFEHSEALNQKRKVAHATVELDDGGSLHCASLYYITFKNNHGKEQSALVYDYNMANGDPWELLRVAMNQCRAEHSG